ncbi:MAG: hypothetical protein RIM84_24930 [Alphaproteobacteria bacterium]
MTKRAALSQQTVRAVAAQVAGHPLDQDRAEANAVALEPILQQLESLRRLPLKDVEPAVVFQPVERGGDD